MHQPLVSIIMPAYNVKKYIGEAIQSIINQTYQNWELLICDDASEDNTLEIVKKFQEHRILIFENKINKGYQNTCNFLFTKCKGNFISFQDADDVSVMDRLEKQLRCFDNDSSLGICGTNGVTISDKGKFIRNLIKPTSDQEIKDFLFKFNPFLGATIMIPYEIYKDVGGYRDFFNEKGYQDYDWSCLIAERYKAYNIQEPLYLYRQHSTSNSKKIEIDRILGYLYVIYLANQRRGNEGKDGLIDDKLREPFNNYVIEVKSQYESDLALFYRDYASLFMYSNLYRRAIEASLKAIRYSPSSLINYRTLFYCIRKSLIEQLSNE